MADSAAAERGNASVALLLHDLVRYSVLASQSAVSFISIPIITHMFAPGDYSKYALANGILSLAYAAFGSGLGAASQRFLAGAVQSEFRRILATVWPLGLLVGAANFLTALLILSAIPNSTAADWFPLAVATIVGLIFVFPSTIGLDIIRSRREVVLTTILTLIRSGGNIALSIGLAALLHNVSGLMWGTTITNAIVTVVLVVHLRNWSPIEYSRSLAADIVRFGIPLSLNNVFAWVLYVSDRYLLQLYRGGAEVGVYALGYDISYRAIVAPSTIISAAAYPIAVRLWQTEGRDATAVYMSGLLRIMVLLILPAVAGMTVLATPLISLLAPADYSGAATVVPIIGLSSLLYALTTLHYPLLFAKRTGFIAGAYLISGAAQIAFNFLVIPAWGYVGAAATTLASYLVLLAILWIECNKEIPWKLPWLSWRNAGIATILMVGSVSACQRLVATMSPVVIVGTCVVVGIVSYVAVLFAFRELKPGPRLLRLARL